MYALVGAPGEYMEILLPNYFTSFKVDCMFMLSTPYFRSSNKKRVARKQRRTNHHAQSDGAYNLPMFRFLYHSSTPINTEVINKEAINKEATNLTLLANKSSPSITRLLPQSLKY
jgi:hypothetical protein